jgi:hypothetical protein
VSPFSGGYSRLDGAQVIIPSVSGAVNITTTLDVLKPGNKNSRDVHCSASLCYHYGRRGKRRQAAPGELFVARFEIGNSVSS